MNCREILDKKDYTLLKEYLQQAKSITTLIILVRNNENYSNFIKEYTSFAPDNYSIYARLMLLYHKIYTFEDIPKCKYCHKPLDDKHLYLYFKENGNKQFYCSLECYYKDPKPEYFKKLSQAHKKRWAKVSAEEKEKIYKKVEQTNLERYGTKCTLNTSENIKKKKETWLHNYGVDNPLKSKEIQQKIQNTNIMRYGDICPLNNIQIKKKAKDTLMSNYGVTEVMYSEQIKEKIRNTCLSKYGVNWVSKTDFFWKKYCLALNNKQFKLPKYNKYHIYKYPSGKEIIVQGYEDIALDYYILKQYNEDDIENSISFMNSLSLKYVNNKGEIHRYIPDFYIKSKNLLIEVKSEFTFYTSIDDNIAKCKAAQEMGYNIEFIVFKAINRKHINVKYKIYNNYEDIEIEKEKYH